MQALQSKTVLGLVVILGLATGLSLVGKLTPEMVDVIKWVGTSFMSVRGLVNYMENKNNNENR